MLDYVNLDGCVDLGQFGLLIMLVAHRNIDVVNNVLLSHQVEYLLAPAFAQVELGIHLQVGNNHAQSADYRGVLAELLLGADAGMGSGECLVGVVCD